MVPTDGREFARQLGAFLKTLTERDISDIARGAASLQVVRGKRSPKAKKPKKEAGIPSKTALRQVLEDLHAASDRETGFVRLDQEVATKAALEALARLADLPVQRRDTVDDLRQKIIEATIGYRLRSKAVQGKDPEGASDTNTV